MPAIFDILYREYCRARLAEMRKQLLISPERHELPEAICEINDAVGTNETSQVIGGGAAKCELLYHQGEAAKKKARAMEERAPMERE